MDGIVQEISFDEDFKTVYEMISSDIMAFKRDGYTLEGFYFDEALTQLIDDTLMDKIEVDLEANIYLKWIPRDSNLEALVTFGDTGNFMALEPYENPSVLEGIYQLNEYIVFVGIYSQFDGYAVAYNTQTSQYYLIYEEGDDLLAIKYEDIADLTLLITELTTLNGIRLYEVW